MRRGTITDRPSGGAQATNVSCTCQSGGFGYACRRCQQPICRACVSAAHSLHETDTIWTVAEELKIEVEAVLSDRIRIDKKGQITDEKKLVANLKRELHKLESREIGSINRHIEELKRALETTRIDLVTRVSHIVKKETDSLNRIERNLKRAEQKLIRIYDDADQLLTKANDIEVVNKAYDLKEEIDEILGTDLLTPSRSAAYDAKFTTGTIDIGVLRDMCGKISVPAITGLGAVVRSGGNATKKISGKRPPTWTHKFSVSGLIFDIHTTPDDRAWICGEGDIKLYDVTGRRHRSVTVGGGKYICYGVTSDRTSVYVACDDRHIYRLEGNKMSVWRSVSFEPVGLAYLPETGQLLVCGLDQGVYTVTGAGVEQLQLEGGIQCARFISVSNTGDVCVTDWDQHKVSIWDQNYRQVGEYDGGVSVDEFKPRIVTCDGRGNFIIADRGNKLLHCISRDGTPLSQYDTTNDSRGEPWCVDMSRSGKLFVGFSNSEVCVYDM